MTTPTPTQPATLRFGRAVATRIWLPLLLVASLLLSACTQGISLISPDDKATKSAASTGPEAEILPVSQQQWTRMRAVGMVRPECPIQKRSRLRVVAINHHDFKGKVQRGRLVVNADVAESIVRIFTELYEREFPIRQMTPVEAFGGDTNASLRADNTSAFNCRRPDQINAPFADSPHANGRAIDINPAENPWLDLRCDCWIPSPKNRARVERPGGINKGGLVWRLFRDEGWIWQNIDVPDYMHFDTGYPSRPYTKRK